MDDPNMALNLIHNLKLNRSGGAFVRRRDPMRTDEAICDAHGCAMSGSGTLSMTYQ
jgi:hypothetical protein